LPVFRVQANDRSYVVSIERTGKGRFKAILDNEAFESDLVREDEVSTWIVRSSGRVMRAHTRTSHGNNVDAWLSGVPFPTSIHVMGLTTYPLVAGKATEKEVGGEIHALMPGRITSILVNEGEFVERGSALLVLEAMKMQNEITSPISGRVKSIRVREGANVKKGSVLIEIEPS